MTPQTDVGDAGLGAEPLLETRGLTKAFGPVEVLSDVSLAFRAGEVHAIIGENGAGKSTLMKIISGHLEPTRGSLRFDGAPLALRGPVDAERRGIVLVHQEIMLAPDLSIAENMFLGRELRRGVAVDDRTMNARAEEAMGVFGVDVSVTVPVQRLSIARRQLAQIARALAVPHRIAIFDEPTASLTPVETGALLKLIRELKAKGIAVIYISHRLEEVKAIADIVTVLRDGKHVATSPAVELQPVDMARLMVGRDLLALYPPRAPAPTGEPAFVVSGFNAPGFAESGRFRRGGELCGAFGRDSRLFRPDRGWPHRVVRGVVRLAQGRRRDPPRWRGATLVRRA
jgi:ribose transport system ATP-binding protein